MTKRALSVFIDESGDFGAFEQHSPYYLVSLVFHDQDTDISKNIHDFDSHLANLGYTNHAVHTGPLIRREAVYAEDLVENRKRLFSSLFHFTRKLDIKYACVKVKKRECNDELALNSRISKQLGTILTEHHAFFSDFERVVVYYDNGQMNLTRIISSVFNSRLSNVEFRKVQPVDYRLFQVADMICTLELLADKAETKTFSRSETEFFNNMRDFKKNYLKWIQKKKLGV